jgi:hypothetical protein
MIEYSWVISFMFATYLAYLAASLALAPPGWPPLPFAVRENMALALFASGE